MKSVYKEVLRSPTILGQSVLPGCGTGRARAGVWILDRLRPPDFDLAVEKPAFRVAKSRGISGCEFGRKNALRKITMTNKLILTLMAFLLASCGMMSAPSVEQPTPIPTFASADSSAQDPAADQVPALGGKQSGDLLVWILAIPTRPPAAITLSKRLSLIPMASRSPMQRCPSTLT